MTHGWIGGLLTFTALSMTTSAQAEGLRCGDKLASPGASLYEVRATCGDPDDAQRSIETRTVPERVQVPCTDGKGMCETVVYRSVQIAVDRWTYDFGSNRFIEFAIFEEGSLVHVKQGPYGQKEPTMTR